MGPWSKRRSPYAPASAEPVAGNFAALGPVACLHSRRQRSHLCHHCRDCVFDPRHAHRHGSFADHLDSAAAGADRRHRAGLYVCDDRAGLHDGLRRVGVYQLCPRRIFYVRCLCRGRAPGLDGRAGMAARRAGVAGLSAVGRGCGGRHVDLWLDLRLYRAHRLPTAAGGSPSGSADLCDRRLVFAPRCHAFLPEHGQRCLLPHLSHLWGLFGADHPLCSASRRPGDHHRHPDDLDRDHRGRQCDVGGAQLSGQRNPAWAGHPVSRPGPQHCLPDGGRRQPDHCCDVFDWRRAGGGCWGALVLPFYPRRPLHGVFPRVEGLYGGGVGGDRQHCGGDVGGDGAGSARVVCRCLPDNFHARGLWGRVQRHLCLCDADSHPDFPAVRVAGRQDDTESRGGKA